MPAAATACSDALPRTVCNAQRSEAAQRVHLPQVPSRRLAATGGGAGAAGCLPGLPALSLLLSPPV